jgi:hypothetical protein
MTSTRRTVTLVLSILGLLALPSLASASVGGQLSKASSALDNAVTAAEDHGDAAAFKAYMKAAHDHTAKAERSARKAKGKSKKAKLMRQVAAQYDENLDEYADLIAWVPTDVQAPVVDAVAISAEARARVVEFLTRIAEYLPEPGRTAVLNAIAAFETDGDLASLFEAFASEDVIGSVKSMILEQINQISAHIGDVLGHLESLTGLLPPGAADALNMAIGMITEHIGDLSTLIDELFSGFGGEGGFFGGFGGFGLGSLCDVLGGLPIPLLICE